MGRRQKSNAVGADTIKRADATTRSSLRAGCRRSWKHRRCLVTRAMTRTSGRARWRLVIWRLPLWRLGHRRGGSGRTRPRRCRCHHLLLAIAMSTFPPPSSRWTRAVPARACIKVRVRNGGRPVSVRGSSDRRMPIYGLPRTTMTRSLVRRDGEHTRTTGARAALRDAAATAAPLVHAATAAPQVHAEAGHAMRVMPCGSCHAGHAITAGNCHGELSGRNGVSISDDVAVPTCVDMTERESKGNAVGSDGRCCKTGNGSVGDLQITCQSGVRGQ